MNKTAYLAGKISGLPNTHVKNKFNRVGEHLKSMGYNVINPVAIANTTLSWDESVRTDIKQMLECDEVHLLPGWQESRGAQLERDIAIRLGMQVVYH